jgi:hypothetical protein
LTALDIDLEALVTAELAGDPEVTETLMGDLRGWLDSLERRMHTLRDEITLLKVERERYIENRVERGHHVERIERKKAELVIRDRALSERARRVRNLIRLGPIETTGEALFALRDALGNATTAVTKLIEFHGGVDE